jgi:hypothetical protein
VSIKAHGGAVRYWITLDGRNRAVLCTDGTILIRITSGSRWREAPLYMTTDVLDNRSDWQADTRPTISSAITRTNREARRDV